MEVDVGKSRGVGTSEGSTAIRYLKKEKCADRYGISWRTWLRLVDAGKAPQPVRFGACVRWAIADLEAWETNGCKPVSKTGGRS